MKQDINYLHFDLSLYFLKIKFFSDHLFTWANYAGKASCDVNQNYPLKQQGLPWVSKNPMTDPKIMTDMTLTAHMHVPTFSSYKPGSIFSTLETFFACSLPNVDL